MNRNFGKYFFLFVIGILVDQITKVIFAARDFFIGPIHFALYKNFGLPFAINTAPAASFVVSLAILILVMGYFWSQKNILSGQERGGLTLILAGALSNMLDRVLLGYVRDFVDLRLTFVFNLADALIFAGILMVLLVRRRSDQTN